MQLSEVVREALEEGLSTDDEVIQRVIEKVVEAADFSVFRWAVQMELSRQRAWISRRQQLSSDQLPAPTTVQHTVVEQRRADAQNTLTLPGKPIPFEQATVAQHLERIEYLRKLRGAVDTEIQRHQRAIDTIRRARVKCLADLKPRSLCIAERSAVAAE